MDMDTTPQDPSSARGRTDPLEEAAKHASGDRRKFEPRDELTNAAASTPVSEAPEVPTIPVPLERKPDNSDLAETQRREAQARADLQSLWEEFNHLKRRYDETAMELAAARQREAQARAELDKATPLMADHETVAGQLRRLVAERDQEIRALQEHIVAAEEARTADAAAFLRRDDDRVRQLEAAVQSDARAREQLAKAVPLIANHESAAERLRLVVDARDQEIDELRQRLLDAEEARVADAAAFLESINKHRG